VRTCEFFINIFRKSFSYESVLHFGFEIWAKQYRRAKAARKMLIKLTTGEFFRAATKYGRKRKPEGVQGVG